MPGNTQNTIEKPTTTTTTIEKINYGGKTTKITFVMVTATRLYIFSLLAFHFLQNLIKCRFVVRISTFTRPNTIYPHRMRCNLFSSFFQILMAKNIYICLIAL